MFNGSKILIVEDEAIIAMHLAVTIEDHRGEVVGPAASVSEAITMISKGAVIHGAILDGNLGDGDVTPIAIWLIENGIPLVIYSGVGIPQDLATSHPGLPMVFKPNGAAEAVRLLAKYISEKIL